MVTTSFQAIKAMLKADPPGTAQWRVLLSAAPDAHRDQLLTRGQAAKLLRVSVRTFDRIAKAHLQSVRYGRRCIRFRLSDVEGLMAPGEHHYLLATQTAAS